MSEYMFGGHDGHMTAQAERIAKRHGAWHVNYTGPGGRRRGWFACPNRGSPFDQATAKAVVADIDKVGGFASLLHKRDRWWADVDEEPPTSAPRSRFASRR